LVKVDRGQQIKVVSQSGDGWPFVTECAGQPKATQVEHTPKGSEAAKEWSAVGPDGTRQAAAMQ
jgi:hypothetical protein